MARRVMVTGGAGFIGSHLVERLIEAGDEVWVVDDLSTGRLRNLSEVRGDPRLHLVVDSILNWPMMDETTEKCDVVYHLAAEEGMRKVMEHPVETIATNVRGTEIVLDCSHRHGCPVFLGSTSEVYGKSVGKLREDQDRIMAPTSRRQWAYAAAKCLDEHLALAYWEEKGLPVVVGRIFNTAGPRQSGQWGLVIPRFVSQAVAGEPLTVHGEGTQKRSFLHVHDAVDAILGLMNRADAAGEVFNIGQEDEITILELAELIRDHLDSGSEIVKVPYEEMYGEDFEDLERRRPDTGKVRELLDWSPTRTVQDIVADVAEGVRAGVA